MRGRRGRGGRLRGDDPSRPSREARDDAADVRREARDGRRGGASAAFVALAGAEDGGEEPPERLEVRAASLLERREGGVVHRGFGRLGRGRRASSAGRRRVGFERAREAVRRRPRPAREPNRIVPLQKRAPRLLDGVLRRDGGVFRRDGGVFRLERSRVVVSQQPRPEPLRREARVRRRTRRVRPREQPRPSRPSKATVPRARPVPRVRRRLAAHERVLRPRRLLPERGDAEGEVDPPREVRGDAVRLERRAVRPHERLEATAPPSIHHFFFSFSFFFSFFFPLRASTPSPPPPPPPPPVRHLQVGHGVVHGLEHARVVVKLRDGLVRRPLVHPRHRRRVLLGNHRRANRLRQDGQGQAPRRVRAHRHRAQAVVADVVPEARERVVQLLVALRQPPLRARQVTPTVRSTSVVRTRTRTSARRIRTRRVRTRARTRIRIRIRTLGGVPREIDDPGHDGVELAVAAGAPRAPVQLQQIVQRAQRPRAPRRDRVAQRSAPAALATTRPGAADVRISRIPGGGPNPCPGPGPVRVTASIDATKNARGHESREPRARTPREESALDGDVVEAEPLPSPAEDQAGAVVRVGDAARDLETHQPLDAVAAERGGGVLERRAERGVTRPSAGQRDDGSARGGSAVRGGGGRRGKKRGRGSDQIGRGPERERGRRTTVTSARTRTRPRERTRVAERREGRDAARRALGARLLLLGGVFFFSGAAVAARPRLVAVRGVHARDQGRGRGRAASGDGGAPPRRRREGDDPRAAAAFATASVEKVSARAEKVVVRFVAAEVPLQGDGVVVRPRRVAASSRAHPVRGLALARGVLRLAAPRLVGPVRRLGDDVASEDAGADAAAGSATTRESFFFFVARRRRRRLEPRDARALGVVARGRGDVRHAHAGGERGGDGGEGARARGGRAAGIEAAGGGHGGGAAREREGRPRRSRAAGTDDARGSLTGWRAPRGVAAWTSPATRRGRRHRTPRRGSAPRGRIADGGGEGR